MSFLDKAKLDKAKEKAKKAAKDAGTEAQKQTSLAKLNLELKALRDDIKKQLTGLGEQTLKLIREDKVKDESLKPAEAEIKRLEERVAEVEGKIAGVKAGSGEQ